MYTMKQGEFGMTDFSKLKRDLQRHLCSLAVLDHRYQRSRQKLKKLKLDNALRVCLEASRSVQSDMRLLSGLIVEAGGAPGCRMEEIEHRSYLPLLLGETFEVERYLRQLLSAEKRLLKMLEHTFRFVSREGDSSAANVVGKVLEGSRVRLRHLAQVRVARTLGPDSSQIA